MIPEYLQTGFEQAKLHYPNAWTQEYKTVFHDEGIDGIYEVDTPYTWQLVDACTASFRTPEREGMLVLQEWRPGSKTPRNHWGFMIAKSQMQEQVR